MPTLNWPEIRARATQFARDWRDETSERAEAQTFWNQFFYIFGLKRRRVAVYEKQVDKLPRAGKTEHGRIDVFWPGTLLVEHKSAGADLTGAFKQALDYFDGLTEQEWPRYVIVSDFQRFRFYDLDDDTDVEFKLSELPSHLRLFGFIAGYSKIKVYDEDPLNIKAVQLLGELHDALKRDGYGLDKNGKASHTLQLFLVRILFCLFADDTGLFSPKDSFLELVERTREDGSDTGALIARLFQILDTSSDQRQRSLEEEFGPFPYINGRLFEERLDIPEFSSAMRALLLDCCRVQWANISPAIFGAMFQKVIELDAKDRRRQLGAHYTSEANIRKVIGPLFLDGLRAEFESVRRNKNNLFAFHKKLLGLTFFDPACGCGNFLVVTYRELRRLELDIFIASQNFGAISHIFEVAQLNVDQFYGIEIEEFPAQIAQVAMWLTDHQMNVEAGREFGEFFARIPLTRSANIRCGNALRLDWEDFAPPSRLNYILGNPPFVGKQFQSAEQKKDLEATVRKDTRGAGILDYVAGWYLKAAQYLSGSKEGFVSGDKRQFEDARFGKQAPGIEDIFVEMDKEDEAARRRIRCSFVSTKSITQGEQVSVLWSEMFRHGIKIHFAHRTFKWSNEAPGKAAVHCVIVGFGRVEAEHKRLFEYAEVDGEPHELVAENINPYLVDAPDVVIGSRREPICRVPAMVFGSMPNDGGHLLLSDSEKTKLLAKAPGAEKWVRPFVGAEEFINGIARWCLWLKEIQPSDLKRLALIMARVEGVRKHREGSKRSSTNKLAKTPTLFGEIRQPQTDYLLVPSVSSERRQFIPVGFMSPSTIASNLTLVIPDAAGFHFGILQSTMHMAWMRYVCGRLKSDFRYSAQIVYNNFPWPQRPEDKHRDAIEAAAQGVLDARTAHSGATLAQLYDPNTMPPNLVKAHAKLDRAAELAYVPDGGQRTYAGDAERVAFLFRRYAELTSLVG